MISIFVKSFKKYLMNDLLLKKTVKKVSDFLNKFDKNIELIALTETAKNCK